MKVVRNRKLLWFFQKMLLRVIIIIIISFIFMYFKTLQMFSNTILFWGVFLVFEALLIFHNPEGNFWVLFVFQGYTLQFVVLSDFVLRRCGAFHNAKDNLWVFVSFATCIPSGLHFCLTWSSDHVTYSTLQKITAGFYLLCELYSLWFVSFDELWPQTMWCIPHCRGLSSH